LATSIIYIILLLFYVLYIIINQIIRVIQEFFLIYIYIVI